MIIHSVEIEVDSELLISRGLEKDEELAELFMNMERMEKLILLKY
ncbi:unknown [Clostridium sp. CAG:149]|nr:unknown [Clostridium sp. CAG:149]